MRCFTLVNARIGAELRSVRIRGARIAAVDCRPQRGDVVIDVQGERVYPGLINAHDHLQLNHLDPGDGAAPERRYRRVADWISDIDERRRSDAHFKALLAVPREQRLLMGALKNVLSGVTSVAHHDPLYAPLGGDDFPLQVVRRYGWSHSLPIDGARAVAASFRETPPAWPWMIHAAEGIDDAAAREFEQLQRLGCVGSNTLLIHGVGMSHAQTACLSHAGGGLIWCPASNMRLFGRTTDVAWLAARGRVALGTDSRLSGARDLLDELCIAAGAAALDAGALERMVTRDAARLLRLPRRGEITAGAAADILILPERLGLGSARRGDVRLVLKGGSACYGDLDYGLLQDSDRPCVQVLVDGRLKMLDARLAALAADTRLEEPGLNVGHPRWAAA